MINYNTNEMNTLGYGSDAVTKMYYGDELIYLEAQCEVDISSPNGDLCLTSLQNGSKIALFNPSCLNKTILYSLDNGNTYSTYTYNTINLNPNWEYITLNRGKKILFKSTSKTALSNARTNCRFYMEGLFAGAGNTNSLINYSTKLSDYGFGGLFYNCTSLTTAPELPATTLATACYDKMFYNCTRLTTAPELPATTLTEGCYYFMFCDCKSLTTAPELPATTLVSSCYNYMFTNCSKLNYIKAMFTTNPATDYTKIWVSGVSSTGTFVMNKDATWDVTGVNGVPEGWTIVTE